MKKTPWKREINAAPAAINPPRNKSAIMIPSKRTSCCFLLSILSLARIITKTKMLSTESAYSVSHPAKNSGRAVGDSTQFGIKIPKMIAALTYTTVQIEDSVIVVSLSFLKIAITKSKAITRERTPTVTSQTVVDSNYLTFSSLLAFHFQ